MSMHKHCVPGFFFSLPMHKSLGMRLGRWLLGMLDLFPTHCFVVCGNKKVLTYMEGVKDQFMPLS